MGIKKYLVFSILFIILVGAYIYSINGDTYTLTLFGVPVTLHIALWVVLPAALLVVASVLHMMFYGFRDYLAQRNLKKDYRNFIEQIKAQFLMEPANISYSSDFFKLPSKLLKLFRFDPSIENEDIDDSDFKKLIDDLKRVENGEVVDLKKYKLPSDNYYIKKNSINEIEKDEKKAESILKGCGDKRDDLCLRAFEIYLEKAKNYEDIKRVGFDIDKEIFVKLLDRFEDKDDPFKFDVDDLIELFDKYEFTKAEYLHYAKKIKLLLNPEAVINLFERISDKSHKAMQAYLYLLFEFGMITKAREILENLDKKECEKFRYFLHLKDSGKNFDIDIFFDI